MEKYSKKDCATCKYNFLNLDTQNDTEVFVYTNIKGDTLSVDSNDRTAEVILMSDVMLKDILTIESGCCDESYLSTLDELSSGLYSNAFLHMINILDNNMYPITEKKDGKKGSLIPQTVKSAIRSLKEKEEDLKETCKRLEEGGLYPGSGIYMDLLRAKYYVETWSRQLQLLVSLAFGTVKCMKMSPVSAC